VCLRSRTRKPGGAINPCRDAGCYISYRWPEGLSRTPVVGAEARLPDPNDRPGHRFKTSDGYIHGRHHLDCTKAGFSAGRRAIPSLPRIGLRRRRRVRQRHRRINKWRNKSDPKTHNTAEWLERLRLTRRSLSAILRPRPRLSIRTVVARDIIAEFDQPMVRRRVRQPKACGAVRDQ